MTAIRRYWPLGGAVVIGIVIGGFAYARLGPSAASLDPNVQTALLFVMGILAGVLALTGALVTSTNQATAVRRDRLDDRLIEQSVRYLRMTQLIRDQQDRQYVQWRDVSATGGHPDQINRTVDATDEIKDVVNALYLVARQGTADAARDALLYVDMLGKFSYDASEYGTGLKAGQPPHDWEKERIELATEFVTRKTTFINAVRAEFDQRLLM